MCLTPKATDRDLHGVLLFTSLTRSSNLAHFLWEHTGVCVLSFPTIFAVDLPKSRLRVGFLKKLRFSSYCYLIITWSLLLANSHRALATGYSAGYFQYFSAFNPVNNCTRGRYFWVNSFYKWGHWNPERQVTTCRAGVPPCPEAGWSLIPSRLVAEPASPAGLAWLTSGAGCSSAWGSLLVWGLQRPGLWAGSPAALACTLTLARCPANTSQTWALGYQGDQVDQRQSASTMGKTAADKRSELASPCH